MSNVCLSKNFSQCVMTISSLLMSKEKITSMNSLIHRAYRTAMMMRLYQSIFNTAQIRFKWTELVTSSISVEQNWSPALVHLNLSWEFSSSIQFCELLSLNCHRPNHNHHCNRRNKASCIEFWFCFLALDLSQQMVDQGEKRARSESLEWQRVTASGSEWLRVATNARMRLFPIVVDFP